MSEKLTVHKLSEIESRAYRKEVVGWVKDLSAEGVDPTSAACIARDFLTPRFLRSAVVRREDYAEKLEGGNASRNVLGTSSVEAEGNYDPVTAQEYVSQNIGNVVVVGAIDEPTL